MWHSLQLQESQRSLLYLGYSVHLQEVMVLLISWKLLGMLLLMLEVTFSAFICILKV